MNTELVCVMASLGYGDGEDYFKGIDCIGMFKVNNYLLFLSDLYTLF